MTPLPAPRELGHEVVDLLLALDVDAVGRLVEDEDVGSRVEPLGQHTFCWLPPERNFVGCSSFGDLDLEPADEVPRDGPLAPLPRHRQQAATRKRPSSGSVMFLRDGERHHRALVLAVLGQQRDAGLHRVARRPDPDLLALDEHAPGLRAVGAEDQPHQLGAPRADEAGDAEQLAGPEREARVLDDAGGGQPLDAQQLVRVGRRRRTGAARSTGRAFPVISAISSRPVDARRCRPRAPSGRRA